MTMNKTTGNNTGVSGSHRINSSGEKMTRMRFIVSILGIVALALSQMSRMILNLSITQMVEHPESHNTGRVDTTTTTAGMADDDVSCPWPEVIRDEKSWVVGRSFGESPGSMIVAGPTYTTMEQLPIGTLVNQVDDGHHQNLFAMSVVNSTQTMYEHPVIQRSYPRYKWSIQQQNVLLGAFFYTYFLFMIIGGRLAEAYGAKYVFMVAVAGSGLINFATPWLADTSYPLLVASRMLMGAIQAGVFPGMYALFGKWLTMTEASIFTPLIKLSLRLGMLLGSAIPGLITGWPNVFYTTGTMSIIWSLAWWVLVSSDPADNQWVSEAELRKINRKKRCHQEEAEEQVNEVNENGMGDDAGNSGEGARRSNCTNNNEKPTRNNAKPVVTKRATPWLKIITCPSVFALMITKLSFNYGLDFLSLELPSYLKYVHHASKEQISSITSAIYLVQVILIVFVGWMAKVAVQRRPLGMNKTGVRKLFQGIANFGLSVTFLSLSFNNCNLLYIAILLQFGSLCSMFDSGGEIMLPYDLSDEYPATIMAIANSFAQLSAGSLTTVAALVLGGHGGSFHRWNILIRLVATVNLIGGLCFTCLVKAEPIDFGDGRRDKERKDLEASIGS